MLKILIGMAIGFLLFSNQAAVSREQTLPADRVGKGALTAGGNQPQPVLKARSISNGTQHDLPEGKSNLLAWSGSGSARNTTS